MLSIAWGMIAQAGLFDLGIGRATTQYVAKLLGLEDRKTIPAVIRLAVVLTFVTGLFAAALFAIAILCGIHRYIKATPEVAAELLPAALFLAATLPVQAVSSTYRGVNEAYSDFKGISLVRIFIGVINFLGPFLVALVTQKLVWLIATIFFSRLLAMFIYRWLASSKYRETDVETEPETEIDARKVAKELISFGGWFTVGSGFSFGLNQSEKLGIAVLISAAAVSAYAIPFEVVMQSLVVATAISTIAFPELSNLVQTKPAAALKRFNGWLIKTMAVMLVVGIGLAVVIPVAFRWWLNEELPPESIVIGQMLCIGIVARTVNVLCFSMIHAYGRADLTTKVRIVELPLHLIILVGLIWSFGVYGAAAAWVLRNVLDSVVLYIVILRHSAKLAGTVNQEKFSGANAVSGGVA